MSLNVNIRESSGVTVVDLTGRVTIGQSAGTLRETLNQLANSGRSKILLNLADVSYIDSSGIGLLVTSFATFHRLGGKLKLVNLNSRVQDLLVITKLYTVFEVYDNESTAVSSFNTVAAPVTRS